MNQERYKEIISQNKKVDTQVEGIAVLSALALVGAIAAWRAMRGLDQIGMGANALMFFGVMVAMMMVGIEVNWHMAMRQAEDFRLRKLTPREIKVISGWFTPEQLEDLAHAIQSPMATVHLNMRRMALYREYVARKQARHK